MGPGAGCSFSERTKKVLCLDSPNWELQMMNEDFCVQACHTYFQHQECQGIFSCIWVLRLRSYLLSYLWSPSKYFYSKGWKQYPLLEVGCSLPVLKDTKFQPFGSLLFSPLASQVRESAWHRRQFQRTVDVNMLESETGRPSSSPESTLNTVKQPVTVCQCNIIIAYPWSQGFGSVGLAWE